MYHRVIAESSRHKRSILLVLLLNQHRQRLSGQSEDIVKYVNELKGDIEVLATSMEETTMKLSEGNEKVEVSLRDIEHMNLSHLFQDMLILLMRYTERLLTGAIQAQL